MARGMAVAEKRTEVARASENALPLGSKYPITSSQTGVEGSCWGVMGDGCKEASNTSCPCLHSTSQLVKLGHLRAFDRLMERHGLSSEPMESLLSSPRCSSDKGVELKLRKNKKKPVDLGSEKEGRYGESHSRRQRQNMTHLHFLPPTGQTAKLAAGVFWSTAIHSRGPVHSGRLNWTDIHTQSHSIRGRRSIRVRRDRCALCIVVGIRCDIVLGLCRGKVRELLLLLIMLVVIHS